MGLFDSPTAPQTDDESLQKQIRALSIKQMSAGGDEFADNQKQIQALKDQIDRNGKFRSTFGGPSRPGAAKTPYDYGGSNQ